MSKKDPDLLYDISLSSKQAVIQNDSMNHAQRLIHVLRQVSIAPPIIKSLSQSRRAEKESRKDRSAGKLSGAATAAAEAVSFCATVLLSCDPDMSPASVVWSICRGPMHSGMDGWVE